MAEPPMSLIEEGHAALWEAYNQFKVAAEALAGTHPLLAKTLKSTADTCLQMRAPIADVQRELRRAEREQQGLFMTQPDARPPTCQP